MGLTDGLARVIDIEADEVDFVLWISINQARMNMKRRARILFLDSGSVIPKLINDFLQGLTKGGMDVEILRQDDLGGGGAVEYVDDNVYGRITAVTSESDFDVIVIGNNLGAGAPKARAVAPRMKPKTIIVWNVYRPGDEKYYAPLGYTNFGSRTDLPQMIAAMLGVL